jgi:hypothetical protein
MFFAFSLGVTDAINDGKSYLCSELRRIDVEEFRLWSVGDFSRWSESTVRFRRRGKYGLIRLHRANLNLDG